jgi:hypothetical protein
MRTMNCTRKFPRAFIWRCFLYINKKSVEFRTHVSDLRVRGNEKGEAWTATNTS